MGSTECGSAAITVQLKHRLLLRIMKHCQNSLIHLVFQEVIY
jgi:hypothetical protein